MTHVYGDYPIIFPVNEMAGAETGGYQTLAMNVYDDTCGDLASMYDHSKGGDDVFTRNWHEKVLCCRKASQMRDARKELGGTLLHYRTLLATTSVTTALLLSAGLASADTVHLDDVIVEGSMCVGLECVDGESFGFDTLRLKDNNLRITAVDTSSTASFPARDWQITFNDASNGGAEKFSIDDITSGRTPFTIEGNAPSHSLYVDDGGRMGFGTSTPEADLHVKSGNTPTLRLEQDGSSGFTPQTWEMAGNETNFFVRDTTNGSLLPFRIQSSAPTNSLYVDTDGDVGFGTGSPQADLDIYNAGADVVLLLSNTAGPSENNWQFKNNQNSGRLNIGTQSGTTPFKIYPGAVTNLVRLGLGLSSDRVDITGDIKMTGTITTGGSCSVGCDRVFDADYDLPGISEHANAMWAKGYLPNVGPTPESGQYNISEKMLRMLNELEQAHIYIAQINERIALLETKLDTQE